ncbi:hypothetical protein BJ508DRAFT_339845 [Ascobolus immersus RN42]|uniref:Uncharacterized protein n=1 Tax=Ascobolus immersus RN42 TaxID=1160509 RepID=A0A3N4IED7_ASCIM|nr:hypothetical protein BJ508DRAFT_339845 [Ascobolus immersus RN42]
MHMGMKDGTKYRGQKWEKRPIPSSLNCTRAGQARLFEFTCYVWSTKYSWPTHRHVRIQRKPRKQRLHPLHIQVDSSVGFTWKKATTIWTTRKRRTKATQGARARKEAIIYTVKHGSFRTNMTLENITRSISEKCWDGNRGAHTFTHLKKRPHGETPTTHYYFYYQG